MSYRKLQADCLPACLYLPHLTPPPLATPAAELRHLIQGARAHSWRWRKACKNEGKNKVNFLSYWSFTRQHKRIDIDSWSCAALRYAAVGCCCAASSWSSSPFQGYQVIGLLNKSALWARGQSNQFKRSWERGGQGEIPLSQRNNTCWKRERSAAAATHRRIDAGLIRTRTRVRNCSSASQTAMAVKLRAEVLQTNCVTNIA